MAERKDGLTVTFEDQNLETRRDQVFDKVLVSVGRSPTRIAGPRQDEGRSRPARLHQDRRAPPHRRADDLRDRRRRRRADARAQGVARGARRRRSDLGEDVVFEPAAIPAVVFTDPELAWAGLTETEAQKQGAQVEIAKFPWAASGRAMTLDRTDGLTKLVIEPGSERVLGVGIVGPGAGEMIAEGTLAIEMGAVAKDLALTIHAHPTLSETVMESAEMFFGHATHVYRPKRKKSSQG